MVAGTYKTGIEGSAWGVEVSEVVLVEVPKV